MTRPRGRAETPEEVADRIEGCRLLAASMRQGARNAVAEAEKYAGMWDRFADLLEQGVPLMEADVQAFGGREVQR